MQKPNLLTVKPANYIKKDIVGKVINMWQGYQLTQLEKDVLTELTMSEFNKFKHHRCGPDELMERTLNCFNKPYKGNLNELNTRCKRKRK